MPPEQAEVALWLRRAHNDWSAARTLFTPPKCAFEIVAFHCQQAVEKTLKAYLISRAVEIEKIHDLGRIVRRCMPLDAAFATLRDDVEPLTQYAVVARYPGLPVPTAKEVARALEVVERVWTFVTSRLPPEVIP